MARRRSIRLSSQDDGTTRALYIGFNIPTDQFKRRPDAAGRFHAVWCMLTGRYDSWGDVLHYMINCRKNSRWVRLGDGHERLADPCWDLLSADEWHHLECAYISVVRSAGYGSDRLLYDDALSAELAREFARLAGRTIQGSLLSGLIVSRRKGGEWIVAPGSLPDVNDDRDIGFGDIGMVG